jgi:excisionase family DNA binding protein
VSGPNRRTVRTRSRGERRRRAGKDVKNDDAQEEPAENRAPHGGLAERREADRPPGRFRTRTSAVAWTQARRWRPRHRSQRHEGRSAVPQDTVESRRGSRAGAPTRSEPGRQRSRGVDERGPHRLEGARCGVTTPLLRAEEVARRLALSKAAIFRLAARGSLPHVKIGRNVRFDSEVLERWIAEHSAGNGNGESHDD